MILKQQLQQSLQSTIAQLYQTEAPSLEIQLTKPEFEGDFTLVCFPLVKLLKKSPDALANEIGEALLAQGHITAFNVIKGFLNLSLSVSNIISAYQTGKTELGQLPKQEKSVMLEYSSPNTNKPLHLGHVRNNLLGFSVANILQAAGYNVIKTQIINDRGIHICKSMIAWQQFGNGETPESTGLKGDKLVGNYYVKFDQVYKTQIQTLISEGLTEDEAKKQAPIILEAQQMLLDWEQGKPEVIQLWEMMNQWVYAGFNSTYQRMGVQFDQVQYESQTYILGKDIIAEGLAKGVLYQRDDQSIWCDLTAEGLDEKLVLRSDGTSVYITQDLGTAVERFKQNNIQQLIYTVGNEQDYHFAVLFKILQKLGYTWAQSLQHLSYGMVDLPSGKMKSREGTVVDADDLMHEMYSTAKQKAQELGKLDQLNDSEKENCYEQVGLGALKYYILKVDPKKRILFNPEESVDFNGNTGPFIQYAYARIQSLLGKAGEIKAFDTQSIEINAQEKALVIELLGFNEHIQKAAAGLSPALMANYVYDVVKSFNSFYQNNPILNHEDENTKNFRLDLAKNTAQVIAQALGLLGIQVVERM
jgi:arginyl-tRNA synthetase